MFEICHDPIAVVYVFVFLITPIAAVTGTPAGATPAYHSLDGASLLAIARAARRRGYVVIWVERFMDVFLARADALCPGSEVPLEAFANSTGLRVHPVPPNIEALRALWVVDYE